MNRKLLMVAGVGLAVGLGGGAGFKVVTRPAPALHAAADSLHADSLAADSLAHGAAGGEHAADSSGHAPAKPPATDGHAAQPAHDPPAQAAAATSSHAPPAPAKQAAAKPPADSTAVRLGRIFAAMKPEDAATVLAKLDDADVKAVLFQLTDRKAAEILSRFPGERAATLTRTLLTDARAH